MKKRTILATVICIFISLAISAKGNQFTIKGTIKGKSSGIAELSYSAFKNNKYEQFKLSTTIHQGKFLFKEYLEEPASANFKIDEIEGSIYIEPSAMKLDISKNDSVKYKLIGSKIQDDFDQIAKKNNYLLNLKNKLPDSNQLRNQLDSFPENSIKHKKLLEKINEIFMKKDSLDNLIAENEIKFIKSNPSSYFPIVSNKIAMLVSRKHLAIDAARTLFNGLSNKVRTSMMGKATDEFIKINENTTIGKIAPDFNAPDTIGKMIKLSDFRGKSYVLLDFWASWCIPCIAGFPHLKVIYSKYHDKGLEIIGITTDRSKADWLTAIKKHNIGLWYQVTSVLDIANYYQGSNNHENIIKKYPTNGIPRYILIDKKGKIIGKWDGNSEDNERNMDKVLKEVFGE